MINSTDILKSRLEKLQRHYTALESYKNLIDKLATEKNIYDLVVFELLAPEQKALFDAYLKRFASIQDYLGTKIFPLLLEVAGLGVPKMSEVLSSMEKEGIITDLSQWIALREARNNLEHDYPDELQQALVVLQYCVDNFITLRGYYDRVLMFARRFIQA